MSLTVALATGVRRPHGRLRRIAIGLGLASVSLTVTLSVLEMAMRFVVPPASEHLMYIESADPLLGVELRPGADFVFSGLATAIPPSRIVISSLGLREREITPEKPPGTRRLVCLGDSLTFGWGVDAEETFCRRLEGFLGPGWQTVNFGVPGYDTAQEVRRLESAGIGLSPDVVVVLFHGNDYGARAVRHEQGSVVAFLATHSALVRWVMTRLRVARNDEGPRDVAGVVAAFDHLAVLGRTHAFVPLVFLPSIDGHEELADALDRLGVARANAQAAREGPDLVIPRDGHPNAEAHRRLAALMAAVLAERRLLEPNSVPAKPPGP